MIVSSACHGVVIPLTHCQTEFSARGKRLFSLSKIVNPLGYDLFPDYDRYNCFLINTKRTGTSYKSISTVVSRMIDYKIKVNEDDEFFSVETRTEGKIQEPIDPAM